VMRDTSQHVREIASIVSSKTRYFRYRYSFVLKR
jgi:hypothetical protein